MKKIDIFISNLMKHISYHTGQSAFHITYGVIKRLFIITIIVSLLLVIMTAGIGFGYFANVISKTDIPSLKSMQTSLGKLSQASTLHYENGDLISEVQSDLIRKIVTSDNISNYVKQGIIATEDGYFYEHNGIVPKAVVRATLQEIARSSSPTGGSTLTQQLVKQQLLTSDYSFTRKAKEILLAMRVETFFSKDDILTAYLNVSPFGRNSDGQNIAGIEAAATGIFGKTAKELTLPQSAYLVGLPQSPYIYTPYTNTGQLKENVSAGIERMKIVLDAMKRDGYITQEEWQESINYDISKDFITSTNYQKPMQSYLYQAVHREAVIALMKQQILKDGKTWESVNESVDLYNSYYFSSANKLSNGGYSVYSTINKDIYDAMQFVALEQLPKMGPTFTTNYIDNQTGEQKTAVEPPQMGSVAIENNTGKIVGFIGGANFSISQTDHAFSTRRSPGSTIKPLLVYAPAIEQQMIYPASMLADTPIRKLQPDGTYWTPTNASGTVSNKFISAREALKNSLNNPTIHLYSSMLAKQINPGQYMEKMGITAIDSNEYINEAASVGGFSYGPTVVEQTSAFTTFANDGQHIPAYLIEKIVDKDGQIIYKHESKKTSVFSQDTAYMMRSMLADVLSSGTAHALRPSLQFNVPPMYVKTGTSDFYQDLWVIASTPRITIGNWYGWDNNYGVKHVFDPSSSGTSQQLWAGVANAINRVQPDYFNASHTFSAQPKTIVTNQVLTATGTLAGSITLSNQSTIYVNGDMTTDLFSTSRPPFSLSYQFSPGASEQDLNNFWTIHTQPQQTETTSQETRETTQQTETTSSKKDQKND